MMGIAILSFRKIRPLDDRFSYYLLVIFPDALSCFLFDGFAYFCILYSLFIVAVSTISHRFVIRARVGDDILNFSGLLIAIATLDARYWIMSVVVSLMVSMSSSSCSVSNRFLNSNSNLIFFDPIRVASTLGHQCFLSTSTSNLMLLITSLLSLPMLTGLIDDCYVCDEVWPVC